MELFDIVIWGHKTESLFDVWTFKHFIDGIAIGYIINTNHNRKFKKHWNLDIHQITTKYFDIIAVLLIAYFWETIEHFFETGLLGQWWEFWFQGVEFWANRIITDPVMLVLGYLMIRNYPKLILPARIISVTWVIIHVFIFPHSLYLHELF